MLNNIENKFIFLDLENYTYKFEFQMILNHNFYEI